MKGAREFPRKSARKSAKSRKSRRPRKGAARAQYRWLRFGLGWMFKLGLVVLVLIGGYAVYLDAIVQEKFSGKRWTIPAKVYARPLELYAGQKLSRDDFLTELTALGYRSATEASTPGTLHAVGKETLELYSRGFQFYEGTEPAQWMRAQFSGNALVALNRQDGSALPVARLEPLLIGGIYPAHHEDRILIRLQDAPPYLVEALVAVEDRNFYSHWGVSLRGFARAMWTNLKSGRMRQGGSTLTQQLVKNFYLTNERSVRRKVTEMLMAFLLEYHYSKDDILEAYLNEVFLAQDGRRAIHGFGLASQHFFAQPLAELQLHQVALLVGMVKGPGDYNPRRKPENALARRNLVLDLMAEQGVISAQQATASKQQPLGLSEQHGGTLQSNWPAFLDLVKRQLRQDYREEDLTGEGLRIFTSLDPILQNKAEAALTQRLKSLEGRRGMDAVEAAMLVVGPETGEIAAMLGGRKPRFAGFNRALDAKRPVGSLIKPAVYLAALERPRQYSLTSWLEDEPISIRTRDGQVWEPRNFDRIAHGSVLLYRALSQSYNLSTARLGLEIGVPSVLGTVERLGVKTDWPAYPSMLLGAGSLSPMQVATLYQTIANGGFNTPLRSIRSVLTADGRPLKGYPFQVRQSIDAGAIYLLQNALQQVMKSGTGRSAYNRLPKDWVLAGKTGTSNDSRDSWFAGFGRDLLAVVWLGRDDNGTTPLTGATGALQVWTDFMYRARPLPLDTPQPGNVVTAWVDVESGQGSAEGCPNAAPIPYIRGSEPTPGRSCNENGVDPSLMDWVRGWLN